VTVPASSESASAKSGSAVALPVRPNQSAAVRYRRSLWLLTKRDLKVRYTTSALGYLWSVLDPLLMAGIYYFVFVVVFGRGAPIDQPYIVFILTGLLPWTWFNGAVNDMAKVFLREAKLVRSTTIPRSIWVMRVVLSKGIEFVVSIPVLIVFVIISQYTVNPAHLSWNALYSLLAILLEAVLITGIGLIVAPIVVFFRDLERAIKLVLRLLFYASPIVYGLQKFDLHPTIKTLIEFNPLAGILSLYRSSFFPDELNWSAVLVSAITSLLVLGIGVLLFRRNVRAVLKEI
jgi:ABC-2 type transport system permease protein